MWNKWVEPREENRKQGDCDVDELSPKDAALRLSLSLIHTHCDCLCCVVQGSLTGFFFFLSFLALGFLLLTKQCSVPYSMSAANTKMKQTETKRSMAVTQETLGSDFLAMVLSVVMVSTVVMPEGWVGLYSCESKFCKFLFDINKVSIYLSWTFQPFMLQCFYVAVVLDKDQQQQQQRFRRYKN